MLIVHGIMALILVGLGIMFFCGKGSFLISGYNTASPDEKKQIDEKALCRAVGGLMLVLAACACIMALSDIFGQMVFLWIGLGLFFVSGLGGAIYISTSKKFKRK